jgi:hypothetical protein
MLNIILFSSLLFAEEAPNLTVEVEKPVAEQKVDDALVPAKVSTEEKATVTEEPVNPKPEEVKENPKKETEVPADYNEAAETVSLLVKAVQDKNWALVIGLVLTLLVFVANKFGLKEKVGSKAVPWVATGLATASALGISFANGLPVTDAISQGILAGLTAIGGWEMLFKHILVPAKKLEEKEG